MLGPRNDEIKLMNMPSNTVRDPRYESNGSPNSTSSTSSFARRRLTLTGRSASRVKSSIPTLTPAEARLANRESLHQSLLVFALICLWYIFSISITVYNKWMFQDKEGQKIFPFPLFTTCLHMLVQFCLSSLVLYLKPSLRPVPSVTPDSTESNPNPPLMTRKFYVTQIGPCGLFTGLDIGLGNFSLRYITLTFYTMCKSSVLGFVLFFAFLFGLEKPSWRLGGVITTMSVGVFLMVAGETEFRLGGFLLVMFSAASSGLRWSLTQILLLRHPVTSNPFISIFFLAPVMFLTLFLLALPVEGLGDLYIAYIRLSNIRGALIAPLILLFPGCLAFAMTASEFALLQRTSVVTLSICGIVKEALTITTATIVFGDLLTTVNGIGLVLTIVTIVAYSLMKIRTAREEARAGVTEHFEARGRTAASGGAYDHLATSDPDLDDGVLALPPPPNNKKATSPMKRPEDLE